MNKFQYQLMESILLDFKTILTQEQMETFSEVLHPSYNQNKPSLLARKLFHKISTSKLPRGASTTNFIDNMVTMHW